MLSLKDPYGPREYVLQSAYRGYPYYEGKNVPRTPKTAVCTGWEVNGGVLHVFARRKDAEADTAFPVYRVVPVTFSGRDVLAYGTFDKAPCYGVRRLNISKCAYAKACKP